MNNTKTYNLPILSNEGGLAAYLSQIKKFPMLDAEEETFKELVFSMYAGDEEHAFYQKGVELSSILHQ